MDEATQPVETAPGERTGSALVRASFPFMEEDLGRTWRLLGVTLAVLAVFHAGAFAEPLPLPVRAVCGVLAAFTWVRAFIFFHDTRHGALFRESPVGLAVCDVIGVLTLSPPSVWKETHDYHHRNNAKIVGASIGSYPVATVRMWRRMTAGQKALYLFIRSPLNMVLAYFTVFAFGMCIQPFLRNPKLHWQGPATLLVHVGLVALAWVAGGLDAALLGVVLPVALANTLGAYLFYAQHNFPECRLQDRAEWNYNQAALESSSMMDMSPLLHWFTGNIGYHHVHHLNHRIPFYRLPEAMAALPELQKPGRTSWSPLDVFACLRLKLWDASKHQWVRYGERA